MANPTCEITLDTSGAMVALEELLTYLPSEPLQKVFSRLDFPTKFVRFKNLPTPAGALELAMALEPTDLLLELLTALRAGNLQGFIVERLHGDES